MDYTVFILENLIWELYVFENEWFADLALLPFPLGSFRVFVGFCYILNQNNLADNLSEKKCCPCNNELD